MFTSSAKESDRSRLIRVRRELASDERRESTNRATIGFRALTRSDTWRIALPYATSSKARL